MDHRHLLRSRSRAPQASAREEGQPLPRPQTSDDRSRSPSPPPRRSRSTRRSRRPRTPSPAPTLSPKDLVDLVDDRVDRRLLRYEASAAKMQSVAGLLAVLLFVAYLVFQSIRSV